MAEENQFGPREMEAFTGGSSQFSDDDDHLNEGRLEKISGDCVPGSNDEDSVEEEEPSDGVHIPPPLNMKVSCTSALPLLFSLHWRRVYVTVVEMSWFRAPKLSMPC